MSASISSKTQQPCSALTLTLTLTLGRRRIANVIASVTMGVVVERQTLDACRSSSPQHMSRVRRSGRS